MEGGIVPILSLWKDWKLVFGIIKAILS